MLRIAVCDDMPDFLDQIQQCILRWPDGPDRVSVDTFTDADTLITSHSRTPFDIILLDVVMPLLSGIDAAKEIRQQDKSVKIVFLTSSPEFAVDSYRVKASNYLLKPLDAKKLYRCLEELSEDILQNAKRILVKGRYGFHRIALQDIEFVESDNKYIHFFLVNKTTLTSSDPLYAYEHKLLLADGFLSATAATSSTCTGSIPFLQKRSGCVPVIGFPFLAASKKNLKQPTLPLCLERQVTCKCPTLY